MIVVVMIVSGLRRMWRSDRPCRTVVSARKCVEHVRAGSAAVIAPGPGGRGDEAGCRRVRRRGVEVLDDRLLGRGFDQGVQLLWHLLTERVQVVEDLQGGRLGQRPPLLVAGDVLRQPVARPSGPAVQTDSDERLRCSTYFPLRER